ncbi:MAG: hypothetical protein AWU57_197 [Marinobacter sp. T13-3]|nr:MAG: hypothetical protein AWU57_197 [Marinobacter sp. T13-3]
MTNAIKIVFTPDANDPAPLHRHYQGQINPQPAFMTLDLSTGEVDAMVSGEIGNGMPADVWHGVRRRYPIRGNLTNDQIVECLNDSELKDALQTIYDNAEVVMQDTNWVGKLNATAEQAEIDLPEPIGYDLEGGVVTNLKAYLADSDDDEWLPEEGKDIGEFVQEVKDSIEGEGWTIPVDVADTLMELWEDRLYNGDDLPQNVAQALLADGRCEDSQWMPELNAYAEGCDPDEDDEPGPRLG